MVVVMFEGGKTSHQYASALLVWREHRFMSGVCPDLYWPGSAAMYFLLLKALSPC